MGEPEEGCDLPRKKRRSSIFKLCPPGVAQNIESQITSPHSVIPPSTPETSEELAIRSYSEKVKEEREKWLALLQERKSYYRSLNSTEKPPITDEESLKHDKAALFLTEEEKNFLEDTGKYDELGEEMKDLLSFASMVKDQQQRVISVEKEIINAARERIGAVRGDICKYTRKTIPLPLSSTSHD